MTEDNTKKVESLFHKIKKAFKKADRIPFLFCPCCGEVKEYYHDPTSRVKQPYDLCWKCQKQYPNNSFVNEVTSISINID